MKTFTELKRNLKKDFSELKKIKIALLGDSATQFLAQGIRSVGFEMSYDFEIWEADFNQIERQIFDQGSEFYEFNPDFVVVFHSTQKLLGKYNKEKSERLSSFADTHLELVMSLHNTIESSSSAKFIYCNFNEIDDNIFGSFANKVESSFLHQIRKINYKLMEKSVEIPNFYICDLSSIQNYVGYQTFFQPSLYVNTDMVLSIEAVSIQSYRIAEIIGTVSGKIKKCLILDLDNTTWGGIIGDDGIENIQLGSLGIGKAFTELQQWAKKLKNRGIIICVCSKNTESTAKEPFEKHPDMVLRLEDIAVFVANWETKVDNIRYIQGVLNIGFDSMVFLDDNPFERNIVRENIPDITVPELPEDPANYLSYLYSLNLFETASFSAEDLERTKLYQIEAKRTVLQKSFANEEDFLKGLEMVSVIEPFNSFNTPRVAQLSQRSNQFNLRTVRYTEAEISKIADSEKHHSFTFTLKDKFGENGLICVVILETIDSDTLFIDTWFMSCRVLKRGMENFTLNTISNYAKQKGYKTLKGEYLPTPKNIMVKEHYLNLGFSETESYWLLDLNTFEDRVCFIEPSFVSK